MSPRPSNPLRLEFALLGMIRREATHGYELLRTWNDISQIGLVWRIKPGSLYAALDKLEAMDFIHAAIIPGDASPQRKEYQITAAGEAAFLRWMQSPVQSGRDFRQDFLSKLYFFEDLDPLIVQQLLSEQQQVCQGWLGSLEERYAGSAAYERQVIAFRIHQIKGILTWLQDLQP